MRNRLRIAAVTASAAIALGVAAPMASAVEHSRITSVSQVQTAAQASTARTITVTTALGTGQSSAAAHGDASGQVEPRARGGAAGKALLKLLRNAGGNTWKAAQRAARGGVNKFKAWANGLSWRDPIKWGVRAATTQTIMWVIEQLT